MSDNTWGGPPGVAEEDWIRFNMELGLMKQHGFDGFHLVAARHEPDGVSMGVMIISHATCVHARALLGTVADAVLEHFDGVGGVVVSHRETLVRPLTPDEKAGDNG